MSREGSPPNSDTDLPGISSKTPKGDRLTSTDWPTSPLRIFPTFAGAMESELQWQGARAICRSYSGKFYPITFTSLPSYPNFTLCRFPASPRWRCKRWSIGGKVKKKWSLPLLQTTKGAWFVWLEKFLLDEKQLCTNLANPPSSWHDDETTHIKWHMKWREGRMEFSTTSDQRKRKEDRIWGNSAQLKNPVQKISHKIKDKIVSSVCKSSFFVDLQIHILRQVSGCLTL